MSTYSRLNKIFQHKLPRKKRSISVSGSGDDDGKWWICWNCGFRNNSDRNTIGDGDGLTYSIGIIDNDVVMSANDGVMMQNSGRSVLLRSNGVESERHNVGSQAVGGCSLCGSKNYR